MKNVISLLGLCSVLVSCRTITVSDSLSRDQQLIVACHRLDIGKVTFSLRNGADVNARFGKEGIREAFQDPWTLGWNGCAPGWSPILALANSSRFPPPPRTVKNTASDRSWAEEQRNLIPRDEIEARERKAITILYILVSHGADVDDFDGGGFSALHSAIYNRHEEMAEALISLGANPNTKTRPGSDGTFGDTPLHRTYWSKDLTQALLQAGADVDAKDSNLRTPKDWCKLFGTPDVLALYDSHNKVMDDTGE